MMNRNRYGLLRRLLCLAVTLAMILSLAACGTPQNTTGAPSPSSPTQGTTLPATTAKPTTAPTTLPTTAPTEPTEPPTQPTEPPTEPTQPVDPEPDPNALVYELTQEHIDEFYRLLDECEALAIAGQDLEAIDASTMAVDEIYEFMNAQCSIALILHYSHTADAQLEQQYLDCVEACTQANDAYIQMTRRVYQSDSPAKDHLFEGWTQEDFDNLMAYDEQIALIQQRNAEIGVEYRATKDDDTKIALYIEFVQNNNTMAQFYGYDNYYTYAYERVYGRDYDMEALNQMRQYGKQYLPKACQDTLNNFSVSFYYKLGYHEQVWIQNFLYSDYDAFDTNYVASYIDTLPADMAQLMRDMLEKDSLFTNASDAMAGAFTTSIGDRSYCYFGPDYASAGTVVHEGGHYYASRYADLNSIPLDLAETHSQGNEWLFITFMESLATEKCYNTLVNYLLYEDIATILICLMVDEFEQRVYSTDLTGFTAEDFDAIMDEVALQYFPNGDVVNYTTNVNQYWRMVVVDQPVYYISYAVSAVASMSLYTMAQEDYDAAMAVYQKLCQEPLEEAGFLGNLEAAGLDSPFDENFYKELLRLIAGE